MEWNPKECLWKEDVCMVQGFKFSGLSMATMFLGHIWQMSKQRIPCNFTRFRGKSKFDSMQKMRPGNPLVFAFDYSHIQTSSSLIMQIRPSKESGATV